ncbi:hypothetical protein HMP0721_1715 [Pseudoramibacter alactolyticus ATCC 23263]|uniref:Uncharacterized protein n=1 Tax=Pseudoramibacter alactolyticus ATCC 23263 TaxID=887929 RepID=E6MI10_9FIRM|nr:hypothetical protein HMP0721_1715 [Pseudoramibacter alactolyticus ATCC 23263]
MRDLHPLIGFIISFFAAIDNRYRHKNHKRSKIIKNRSKKSKSITFRGLSAILACPWEKAYNTNSHFSK